MTPQKRNGRLVVLLKSLILGITCLSFLGLLACDNTGTVSTTSASGGSGTGTGWRIDIQVGTNPIQSGQTTTVMAIVKDSSGAPAPSGTNVCMTAVRNCFIKGTECFATLCNTTSNNLGQTIQTYAGGFSTGTEGSTIGGPGDDRIEVSSQGVIATKVITVNN
jgi:hypothetical protein